MLPAAFNLIPLLTSIGQHKRLVRFRKKQVIFSHGDRSDAIFYVEKGIVKLTIASADGKEAFIGLHDGGDFFGESCLAPEKPTRFHTATAVTDMHVLKVDRATMIGILRTNAEFAYGFITHLLKRNQQIQEDLVNNLLSSSTERLVQVLSSLNRSGRSGGKPAARLSQQDLANMIGITRQRTNVLIQRIRKQSRRPGDS